VNFKSNYHKSRQGFHNQNVFQYFCVIRELLYNRKNTHILLGLHIDYCLTSPSVVRSVQSGVVRPGPGDEHHQGQTRDPSRGDIPKVRPLLQFFLLALLRDSVVGPDSLNPDKDPGFLLIQN
jgi:hypothetical protein